MADQFDKNGYNSGDFKRNDAGQMDEGMDQDQDGSKLNEKAGEYMRELLSEKIKLNTQKFPVSCKLIDQGNQFCLVFFPILCCAVHAVVVFLAI